MMAATTMPQTIARGVSSLMPGGFTPAMVWCGAPSEFTTAELLISRSLTRRRATCPREAWSIRRERQSRAHDDRRRRLLRGRRRRALSQERASLVLRPQRIDATLRLVEREALTLSEELDGINDAA